MPNASTVPGSCVRSCKGLKASLCRETDLNPPIFEVWLNSGELAFCFLYTSGSWKLQPCFAGAAPLPACLPAHVARSMNQQKVALNEQARVRCFIGRVRPAASLGANARSWRLEAAGDMLCTVRTVRKRNARATLQTLCWESEENVATLCSDEVFVVFRWMRDNQASGWSAGVEVLHRLAFEKRGDSSVVQLRQPKEPLRSTSIEFAAHERLILDDLFFNQVGVPVRFCASRHTPLPRAGARQCGIRSACRLRSPPHLSNTVPSLICSSRWSSSCHVKVVSVLLQSGSGCL